MSDSSVERQRYERAKALIKSGEYAAARVILADMEHPAAQRLLEQLDQRFPASADIPEKRKGNPASYRWLILVLFVMILLTGGIVALVLGLQRGEDNLAVVVAPTETVGQITDIPTTTPTIAPTSTLQPPTMTPTPAPQRLIFDNETAPDEPLDGGAEESEGRLIRDLPLTPGQHRISVTSDGALNLSLTTEDDACNDIPSLVNLAAGDAADGFERLFGVGSCDYDLIVRDTGEDWTITIEPLSLEIVEAFEPEYSSEEGRLLRTIGPVRFPMGSYQLAVETSGDFVLDITLVNGACNESFAYLSVRGDVVRDTAPLNSEGCTVMLSVMEATAPWILSITETD